MIWRSNSHLKNEICPHTCTKKIFILHLFIGMLYCFHYYMYHIGARMLRQLNSCKTVYKIFAYFFKFHKKTNHDITLVSQYPIYRNQIVTFFNFGIVKDKLNIKKVRYGKYTIWGQNGPLNPFISNTTYINSILILSIGLS